MMVSIQAKQITTGAEAIAHAAEVRARIRARYQAPAVKVSTQPTRSAPSNRPTISILPDTTPGSKPNRYAYIYRYAIGPRDRRGAKPPGIVEICDAVQQVSGFKKDFMLTSKQRRPARARLFIPYIARSITPLTMQVIGKFMGGVDHTRAVHAVMVITELRNAGDPATLRMISEIRLALGYPMEEDKA